MPRRRLIAGTLGAAGLVTAGAGALVLAGDRRAAVPGDTVPAAPSAPPAPPEQQVLRLSLAEEPETIDPQRASFVSEVGVVMRVFSNLLRFDRRGELVPEMAESLPVISPDGKTLTFTLRAGLTYSDGRPLGAKDFEFAWKRHLDPRVQGPYAFVGDVIDGAEAYRRSFGSDEAELNRLRDAVGVQARDGRTLEFRLVAPAPWFVSVLATWCGVPARQDVIQQAGARWTEPPTYIGNGPYVLKVWDRQSRLGFEANPRYFRGPPPLRRIELMLIDDPAAALAAYQNDDLDIVAAPRPVLPVIDGDARLRREHQRFAGAVTTFLGFSVEQPPMDRLAVRKAIAAAIDREALVQHALGGMGVAATQLVPRWLPGSFPELRGQRADLPQARRWLAEAGYGDGRDLGELTLAYPAGATMQERAEALAEQLRQRLGISVSTAPVEPRTYPAAVRSLRAAPTAFLMSWVPDYPDPHDWYASLFHSMADDNYTGWKSVSFDRLVEQAAVETDPRRRAQAYERAAQILLDETPAAFLYHGAVSRLVKPYVAGLPQSPLDFFEGQSNLEQLRILQR